MKIRIELEGEASVLLGSALLRLDADSALELVSKLAELDESRYVYGVFTNRVTPNFEAPYKIYKI